MSIGLRGPSKGPDQLFSATQLYVTGSSDVLNNPTNATSWADAGGINGPGKPANQKIIRPRCPLSSRLSLLAVPSWDQTTGDFAPLLESRQYCASASGTGGGTFNYNTSTWAPGTYEVRVRTIVYYGSGGVESNGTAPGGGERFCISPPYTSESRVSLRLLRILQ